MKSRPSGEVLFVTIDAPPLNLLGPELVSDLVELIKTLDQGEPYEVAVFTSADPDFLITHVDTDVAELYGWINRALPQNEIADFVSKMAHRIAGFPRRGLLEVKARMNELTLQPTHHFRQDSDAFSQGMKDGEVQATMKRAMQKGFGKSKEAELRLGALLGEE